MSVTQFAPLGHYARTCLCDPPVCAQEEGYPPPTEMPIKKLEFTPFKPPAPMKVSDASSKSSTENGEVVDTEDASSTTSAEVPALYTRANSRCIKQQLQLCL